MPPKNMAKDHIAILGGDRRTACMAPILAEKGYRVICFHTVKTDHSPAAASRISFTDSLKEALDLSSIVIAGIPFAKSGFLYCEDTAGGPAVSISEFQRSIHRQHKIFAGVIPESFRRTCEEREICCHDFMSDGPIALYNAAFTAEGAILEALLHKDTSLHRSDTLVLGFGRCARALADRLDGLHACVTICTSDENELALASTLGFDTLHLSELRQGISCYEYIFNTIPACVLDQKCLEQISHGALVIDIASDRAGADYGAAERYGVNIRFCPGLPGRYAGESCAKYLAGYVISRAV